MLLLGVILGVVGGFLLTWWVSRKSPPPEPFFMRLLRVEKRSSRVETRLMLHELRGRVEELSCKVQRIDEELQKYRDGEASLSPAETVEDERAQVPTEEMGGIERCQLIFQCAREGMEAGEIAQRLRMGQGEVEFVLSLDSNPYWSVERK